MPASPTTPTIRPSPSDGIFELEDKRGEFVVAARQRRKSPALAEYAARRRILKPVHPEHLDRRRDPANALRPQRLDFHKLSGSSVGVL